MATVTAPRTLDDVCDLHAGVSYPGHLLEGCATALLLFCAHWHGRQDAYWIADAGMRGTCIDANPDKLVEMMAVYPVDWTFKNADVYEYAEHARQQWDVVSLDPWTNQFQECADRIDLWCSLARRLVILGTGHDTKVNPPDGWRITEVTKRSDHNGGVYWTCLEPA